MMPPGRRRWAALLLLATSLQDVSAYRELNLGNLGEEFEASRLKPRRSARPVESSKLHRSPPTSDDLNTATDKAADKLPDLVKKRLEQMAAKLFDEDGSPSSSLLQHVEGAEDSDSEMSSAEAEAEHDRIDREEEEHVNTEIMTRVQYQHMRHVAKRHHLSMKEAQHALQTRFKADSVSTPSAAASSILEMERKAQNKDEVEFWRSHREALEKMGAMDTHAGHEKEPDGEHKKEVYGKRRGSAAKIIDDDSIPENSSVTVHVVRKSRISKLADSFYSSISPAVSAYACLQVNVDLTWLGLPFITLNFGILGQLSYDFFMHCWAWKLEVSIGITAGFDIGWGLTLGVGISLTGTWDVTEVPFESSGLEEDNLHMTNYCNSATHNQVSGEGGKRCHTGNPVRLVMIHVKRLLGAWSEWMFPRKRAQRLVTKAVKSISGSNQTKFSQANYLAEQARRWSQYKQMYRQDTEKALRGLGSTVAFVECVYARSLSHIRSQKMECVLDSGRLEKSLDFESQELGSQKVKGIFGKFDGARLDFQGALTGSFMLFDSYNRHVKVTVRTPEDSDQQEECIGATALDADWLSQTGQDSELSTTKGVHLKCQGSTSAKDKPGVQVKVTKGYRRGVLSIKCLRAVDVGSLKTGSQEAGPYCKIKMVKGNIVGQTGTFFSTEAVMGKTIFFGEGTSFSVFTTKRRDELNKQWPLEGKDSSAVLLALGSKADHWTEDNQAYQQLRGTWFTWHELLGEGGFEVPGDELEKRFTIAKEFTSGDWEKGEKPGEIVIQVTWTPIDDPFATEDGTFADSFRRSKQPKFLEGINDVQLTWAAAGLHTAAESFLSKLPKYAEQVVERLVDNVATDTDTSSFDCAIEYKEGSYFNEKKKRCPLLDKDGSHAARSMRDIQQGDPRNDTKLYSSKEAFKEATFDDRVINFAKAARVSEKYDTAEFWFELAKGAGDLFVRSVQDVQALFNTYFADGTAWGGGCDTLAPAFDLPFEYENGTSKGSLPQTRYKEQDLTKADDIWSMPWRPQVGKTIASMHHKMHENYTFNPVVDHSWAYGHGFQEGDLEQTEYSQLRFLTPDPPTRGRLKGYNFEGALQGTTVYTNLWCKLARKYWERVRAGEQKAMKQEFNTNNREVLNEVYGVKQSYPQRVQDATNPWADNNSSWVDKKARREGDLQVFFYESCRDETDCGTRLDCEQAILKVPFMMVFPKFTIAMKTMFARIKKRLQLAFRGRTDSRKIWRKRAQENALEIFELMRHWLLSLGACNKGRETEGSPAEEADKAKPKDKRTFGDSHMRRAICAAARNGKGAVYDPRTEVKEHKKAAQYYEGMEELLETAAANVKADPEHEHIKMDKQTLLHDMADDFLMAFGVKTRLPLRLQHTEYARGGRAFVGVLWSMLPKLKEDIEVILKTAEDTVKNGASNDDEEAVEEDEILANLRKTSESRLKRLAERLDNENGLKPVIEFPLVTMTFTLTLTFETATPGFCTPNEALLWLAFASRGAAFSWQENTATVVRCATAKVHPLNFYIQISKCNALDTHFFKGGSFRLAAASVLKTLGVFGSRDKRDSDLSLQFLLELFDFADGATDSFFSNLGDKFGASNKFLSSNFLTPTNAAIGAETSAAQSLIAPILPNLQAGLTGILASPFVLAALDEAMSPEEGKVIKLDTPEPKVAPAQTLSSVKNKMKLMFARLRTRAEKAKHDGTAAEQGVSALTKAAPQLEKVDKKRKPGYAEDDDASRSALFQEQATMRLPLHVELGEEASSFAQRGREEKARRLQELQAQAFANATNGTNGTGRPHIGAHMFWVLHVTGTKYRRYFKGEFDDGGKTKHYVTPRSWHTFQIHTEAWNYLTAEIGWPGVGTLHPVTALNFDFDLTLFFTAIWNKAYERDRQKRIKFCQKCIKDSLAYCSRKHIDPRYDAKKHEKCLAKDTPEFMDCNKVVVADGNGDLTSPVIIAEHEDNCDKYIPKIFANEAFKRRTGPSMALHGHLGPKAYRKERKQYDKYGNPKTVQPFEDELDD
eukprot:TRINITY_DN41306_c0_g1_i1.p1 TRINITY_DN41306_c0_g1~~TRINITY_DN41306_c0_g1_i1.p1  ORF type:complete len:2013 (+),score=426.41 TRINITY_DN41306_c0_g1_i1:118-6156(+)